MNEELALQLLFTLQFIGRIKETINMTDDNQHGKVEK